MPIPVGYDATPTTLFSAAVPGVFTAGANSLRTWGWEKVGLQMTLNNSAALIGSTITVRVRWNGSSVANDTFETNATAGGVTTTTLTPRVYAWVVLTGSDRWRFAVDTQGATSVAVDVIGTVPGGSLVVAATRFSTGRQPQ